MQAPGRWTLLLALIAVGCIPVPRGPNPLDLRFMTPEQLGEYSEQVFRHQNAVLTRMMFAGFEIDLLDEEPAEKIRAAERAVNETCDDLNRLASMRMNDDQASLLLMSEAWFEVRSCQQRTDELEQLLNRHGIPG
ncbi:MAG: hypothetical protein RQ729_01885 [Wenzhouxiangellaceae bacterium]|nr:hypothetical protein [Wenzhouxiangellaceae bacterium]